MTKETRPDDTGTAGTTTDEAPRVVATNGVLTLRRLAGAPADSGFWCTMAAGDDVHIPLTLESAPDAAPGEATLALASTVVAELDALLARAERHVRAVVAEAPEQVAMTPEAAAALLAGTTGRLVDAPEIVVYADGEVLVRFTEGVLPCCEPYGLAVVIRDGLPCRLENLADSTPVDE